MISPQNSGPKQDICGAQFIWARHFIPTNTLDEGRRVWGAEQQQTHWRERITPFPKCTFYSWLAKLMARKRKVFFVRFQQIGEQRNGALFIGMFSVRVGLGFDMFVASSLALDSARSAGNFDTQLLKFRPNQTTKPPNLQCWAGREARRERRVPFQTRGMRIQIGINGESRQRAKWNWNWNWAISHSRGRSNSNVTSITTCT